MQGVRGSNPLSSTTTSAQVSPLLSQSQGVLPWRLRPLGGYVEDNPHGDGQAGLDDRDHAGLHLWGRVPVGHPHRAVTLAASTALVAHQLVDHPAGDACVLQPGREGVAQVVRSSKVEVGEASGRDRRLVDPAVVPGRQLSL